MMLFWTDMKAYHDLAEKILADGFRKANRTETDALTLAGMIRAQNNHIWDKWCSPDAVPYATDDETKTETWNPVNIPRVALPPCHYAFQVTVIHGRLNLLWNQRSVDVALGLPFGNKIRHCYLNASHLTWRK